MKLSYYLFKQGVGSFEEIILEDKVNEDNNYQELEVVTEALNFETKVYIQKNKSRAPKWLKFLERDVAIENQEELKNTVNSFIILVKITNEEVDYYFGITAGFGFVGINKERLESDFGLKVALNSISPQELKALDVRNIDLKTKQKRVHINKGSELEEFDLDVNQDILNLVSGKCENKDVGTSIRGTTSLNLNSKVNFRGLGSKCRQLLDLYLSEVYKDNFAFVDNMKLIKSRELCEELSLDLWNHVNSRVYEKITLTYPDMIEYERCNSYKIISSNNISVSTSEVDIQNIYELIQQENITTLEEFEKIKVLGLDETGQAVTEKVPLREFIVYEILKDDKTYIFTMNKWFEIEEDYYQWIDNQLENIELVEMEQLTDIMQGEGEDSYNERQDASYFLCLDKRNFQVAATGNSRSKIEICDLLSKNLEFVCVKKKTASATLSHLFAQGSVSMELLRNEPIYREKVVNHINGYFDDLTITMDNFPYSKATVVYAITTDKDGDIRKNIPFFSKVNLLQHVKRIRELGMKVKISKISISEN